MPWTPEREAWFKNLEETLRKMLLNIDAFFNKTKPKDFMQIIDSKQVPLLAPARKE